MLIFGLAVPATAQPAPVDSTDELRPGYVRLNLEGNIKLQALIDLIEGRQAAA